MKAVVIGGGASGMMCGIFLAKGGVETIVLEKNEKLGKKMYITGKGRCNVTNDCTPQEFLENVVHGEKFLRSAIYSFTPADMMVFLENAGLPLVTERGNRVFPLSQKSNDVIKTLSNQLKIYGATVKLNSEVKEIKKTESGFQVITDLENYDCDNVVVATGGISYPSTGSTGDGYKFAKSFGHKIVEPRQALSPIITVENVKSLEGLSLKNVQLTAIAENGKVIRSEFGEMLFTANGISGPIAISLSSYINRLSGVKLSLDLKPALDDEKLENRILRDFEERKNQDLKNVTRGLLPDRLNTYVLNCAQINENKKVNSVTKEERMRLQKTLKNLQFKVKSLAPFAEAIVTAGGVDIKDLTPNMESKLEKGLYFIGETCDVDALTGGFNLQIAYSTAYVASKHILTK